MTSFHEFLTQLLNDGKVVFRSARAPHDRPRAEDIALLEKAHHAFRLSVAGPSIPFDPAVGYSAAELIRQASWALVNHDDRVSHLKKRLTMPIAAGDAGASPFGRFDAALLAADPEAGSRARSVRPADRSSGRRAAAMAALGGALGRGRCRRSALSISADTRVCCCFMPSGSRPTTGRRGGRFNRGRAGSIMSS